MFGGNTSILKQHKLNVNYNGKRVDPSSIDWNRVNMGAISFTQAPGPDNVLGKVKFLYPEPALRLHARHHQAQSSSTSEVRVRRPSLPARRAIPARSPPSSSPRTRACRRPRSISCSPSGYNSRRRYQPPRARAHDLFHRLGRCRRQDAAASRYLRPRCRRRRGDHGQAAKPEAVADNAETARSPPRRRSAAASSPPSTGFGMTP